MSLIDKVINILKKQDSVSLFPARKGIDISKDFKMGNFRNIQVLSNESKVLISSNVVFREFCNILMMYDSTIRIDKNVFFNNYCSINCLGEIVIGENTLFGEGVKIYDHNHLYSFGNESIKIERNQFKIGKVKIGRDCWIGSNVTILNNVEIGDNVIIGANCLIYKSIPSNSIVKHKEELIIT